MAGSNPMALRMRKHAPALKMLHWKKVPPMKCVAPTLWHEVKGKSSLLTFELEEKELEALLCEDPKAEKKKKKTARKQQRPSKFVSLLDMKRAQNIGIALAQFRCSHDEICRAILEMDMDVLDLDKLLSLKSMLPSADEEKTLQAYLKQNKGESAKLGPAEQFLLKLASLPFPQDWIGAMLFREEFQLRKEELGGKLRQAIECAVSVRSCVALRPYARGGGRVHLPELLAAGREQAVEQEGDAAALHDARAEEQAGGSGGGACGAEAQDRRHHEDLVRVLGDGGQGGQYSMRGGTDDGVESRKDGGEDGGGRGKEARQELHAEDGRVLVDCGRGGDGNGRRPRKDAAGACAGNGKERGGEEVIEGGGEGIEEREGEGRLQRTLSKTLGNSMQ
eukprot:204245-Hanusia_phi.AAC.1